MFSQIIGNRANKDYLKKLIEEKTVANTLLFYGIDGIGKSLFVKELAFSLMYPDKDKSSFQKKKIFEENHGDFHVYRPEGKTGMHSIVSVRELIENVFLHPFEANAKVFVIHDAERMLPTSSNALLKTLEEPTYDSFIILLSSKVEDLLPTIVSRCYKIKFQAVNEEDISQLLEKKYKLSALEAKHFASLSQGSISQAIDLVSHIDHKKRKEVLFNILAKKSIFSHLALNEAIKILDEYYDKKQKDNDEESAIRWYKDVDLLFSQLLMWYRDLHLLKYSCDKRLLFHADFLPLLQQQDLNNIVSLEKVHALIDQARNAIRRNIRLRTCLEQLFFQLDLV